MSGAQYTRTYTYDNLNRLLTVNSSHYTYADNAHLHAATNTSAYASYSYDASGDMTCRAPNSATGCGGSSPTGAPMGYDIQGQLASWQNAPSSPTTTAKYLYDGEGQRVEQQVTASGTTTTTLYLSNLEDVAITGSTTTNTAYFYANGQRIALAVNGAISYLGSDGLGSATTTLDSNGNAQASELYMPYGGGRWGSGTMPTRRLFTGQVSDAASGLDYYNARSYDPALGQFASADTYDAGGLNRYAYVDDNPTSRTDQDGHCLPFCAITAAIGGVIGIGVGIAAAAQSGQPVTFGTIAHVAADAALGASAGFFIGSGDAGAIVGAATATVGVLMSGVDIHSASSLQSAFEQITISADAGALGGVAASGIEKGTFLAGVANTAASKIVANMATQSVIGFGGELTSEVLGQQRNISAGRGLTLDPTLLMTAWVAGGASGLIAGSMGKAIPRATSAEIKPAHWSNGLWSSEQCSLAERAVSYKGSELAGQILSSTVCRVGKFR